MLASKKFLGVAGVFDRRISQASQFNHNIPIKPIMGMWTLTTVFLLLRTFRICLMKDKYALPTAVNDYSKTAMRSTSL